MTSGLARTQYITYPYHVGNMLANLLHSDESTRTKSSPALTITTDATTTHIWPRICWSTSTLQTQMLFGQNIRWTWFYKRMNLQVQKHS